MLTQTELDKEIDSQSKWWADIEGRKQHLAAMSNEQLCETLAYGEAEFTIGASEELIDEISLRLCGKIIN